MRGDARRRIAWRGPQILRRPRDRLSELASGAQRPIGIAQQFARKQRDIGLAVANDLIRLGRRGDHAYGRCRYSRFPPNALSERNLIAGTDWNLGVFNIKPPDEQSTASTPRLFKLSRKLDRLLEIPAAVRPVGQPKCARKVDR